MIYLQRTRLLVMCVLLANCGLARGQRPSDPTVLTCDKLALAHPGDGVAYKGIVRNSDYRFWTTIPAGLVAWGGVAPGAPFHGFVIFLGSKETSCIVFYIHIRVELPDDDVFHEPGKRAIPVKAERRKVGNRTGLQIVESGSAGGTEFENVTVSLELPREGYKNDAVFRLATPKDEAAKSRQVFERFLAAFHFW